MKTILKILLPLLFLGLTASGQDFFFSNLNSGNGLSDNFIRSLAVDEKGFLWIGTNFGLNSYDGYSITNYPEYEYPEIPSRTIVHMLCDNENNIWMGSTEGVCWVDSKRKFHRVFLQDTIKNYNCSFIAKSKKYGVILFTNKGQFVWNKVAKKWGAIDWDPEKLNIRGMMEVINYDESKVIVANDSLIMLLDYDYNKVLFKKKVPGVQTVCRVMNNNIGVLYSSGRMEILNIQNGSILHQIELSDYAPEKKGLSSWSEMRYAAGDHIVVASGLYGFFIVDKDYNVIRPRHNESDRNSIASEDIMRVLPSNDGNIILGTYRAGISTFNVLIKKAGYQRFFLTKDLSVYTAPVGEMVQDKSGILWMSALDKLVKWNRQSNLAEFYQYQTNNSNIHEQYPEVYRICIDKHNQIWVSLMNTGIASFNQSTGSFSLIKKDTLNSLSTKSNRIYKITASSDNKLWIASESGLYRVDPITRRVEPLDNHPILKEVCSYTTHNIIEDSQKRIWFSTRNHGLFCYDPVSVSLKQYTMKDGLSDSTCFELFTDSHTNIYVTMSDGFQIISPDGKIKTYNRGNGLKYEGVSSIIEDNEGKIWIGNAKSLLKLDPVSEKIDAFGESSNFYNGFRRLGVVKLNNGEIIWGTQIGVNYFFPKNLSPVTDPLSVCVYKIQAGDSLFTGTEKNRPFIRYRNNNLQFDFVAINLLGSINIHYMFMLEGYDKKWQEVTDIRQARYSSLPPGTYTFKVKASIDGKNWISSANSFSFRIIAPIYMKWWFKFLLAVFISAIVMYLFYRRNIQLKNKKEELEAEQAINYFSSSLYEHHTTEDILWDVARNCIGRLKFEDCVIYLLDKENNTLVQKAAHGPKSPRSFEITQPIVIPAGKGIVGSVAESMKAEIIPDTTKDKRYLADDAVRLSEITVPIVSDGKLLGIIDCEHSKKGFFTQKHLSILNTIASLCANKITRARTEAEKREAEKMLAETKQKMAEAEMQALRAQMNPHFIFNCLNSINRYIVKSDQATASLYLTRFAKLIRLILDNSHSKNVILANELEALRLYIEMESLRFDQKFSHEIIVDNNVPQDSIEIPPLIIQPYIENAIWHGLLHKTEAGSLKVHISLLSPGMLQCTIDDNGVGREKAAELKSKTATKKKSLGMELTESRLLLLNQYASVYSSVEIKDLKNENGEASGTKVILKIPFGDN